MNKEKNINTHTLDLLPVAVVLFNNDEIYYLNKKAISLFKIPKTKLANLNDISIFDFLNKTHHTIVKKRCNEILKGKVLPSIELPFVNHKNETIHLEVKSNSVIFKGKKVIQTTFLEINDRIERYNQLENTKQILTSISKSIKEIIYKFSFIPSPHISFISDSVYNMLGRKPSEIYKNPTIFLNQIHPDDKQKYVLCLESFLRVTNNNLINKETFRFFHKNGKELILEVSVKPKFENNVIVSFIGVIRDITKEQNYHIQLEQKWINYKNLLDTSPIGIFIHEGYCIYSNKTAATILEEKNPTKLIGKYLIDFIVPEQRQRAINRMSKAIKGEELSDLVYKVKTVKGKIIEVELKTVPFIYNGKPCVQTTISNISAEKQLTKEKIRAEIAEENNKELIKEIDYRKRIEKELVTQSTKYEAIFNSTSYFIWTVDRNLKITSFNKNYQNYIKDLYKHQLKVGQHISDVGSIVKNPTRVKYWINLYTKFFKTKKDNTADFYELKHTSSSGNTYYRELYFHPIRSGDGKISEIAVIGQDTTERRRVEQKIIDQSTKLEAIYESGEQLNWTVNRNYYFTSFNKNFVKAMFNIYHVKPEISNKVYNPHKTKLGKQYHKWWLTKYDEVFANGKSIEFTTEQYNTDNKKLYRQILLHPIYKNGIVDEISCISNDITELKHLQNESINQAAKLTSIFESSSHLIWTIDKNYNVTSFNNNFSQVFKNNHGINPKLNVQLHTILPKKNVADYKNYWYPIYDKVLKGNTLKIERQQGEFNGKLNFKEIFLSPIKNEKNEIIEIACLAHDVSDNKFYEQQIINQSAKLKTIFESGDHLIWTVNKKFELTSYNKNYTDLINISSAKKLLQQNKTISVFDTIQKQENKNFWLEKYTEALSGKPLLFIHHSVIKDKDVYRQIYLYPILLNNQVVEVSVIAQNITERIENENKITQSLKEKEILLKEVHHRVKNNMQVISSILNLQSSYVKDTYALNLLKECQNRIKSMAFIHESLYQTKNFESVNFSDYVSTLAKNLVHSYSINTKKIKLILTLDKLYLNLDLSIPCGLIINEIISNSLKYAFPNNLDGIIFVTLKANNNKVNIQVGDNGIGISNQIDIKNTQTLGLQLVDTLVEQINGTINLNRNKGTIFNIDFNI